jgi:NAD(P)-dependent dehydrogenase (short-subunit alcohol dehydrogenase family)
MTIGNGGADGDFAGRTVVVTGGGSGIGRAMVKLFSGRGAKVMAVDIDPDRCAAVEREAENTVGVVADIATAEGVATVMDAVDDDLSVLCNNAGVLDRLALLDETSDEVWDRVLAVNLSAAFRLSREAVPRMIKHGGGAIVNTASTSGEGGGRAGVAYTASKAGLIGMTLNVAVSYGAQGIRCNAICPGGTKTGMQHNAAGAGEALALSERGLEMLSRLGGKPPPAEPEQVAEVAVFLASDAASRINGVAVRVDGGAFAY